MARPTTGKPVVYALFFLSGATGLVYELVWTRELIFVFGGTTYAITTVVVAFMAGLGLGSYLGGRVCSRFEQPGRVYGALEIAIGLYALMVPVLFGFAEPMYRALYPHVQDLPWVLTAARFCVGGLVMIVPTTCMGATLPILVRHVTLSGQAPGRSVGHLYGINTLGATAGTALAGFLLIPGLGLLHTTWAAAAANVLIGLTAITVLGAGGKRLGPGGEPDSTKGPRPAAAPPLITPQVRLAVLIAFALSGFAAMVYQIAWTRALVMSLGSSTYSFTCILTAFILGLGLGSLAIARWVDRWRNPVRVFGILELAIGLTAVLIVPLHGQVPRIVARIVADQHQNYSALLGVEFLLIIAVTFVPTFLLGAVFPLVTRIIAQRPGEAGAATGRAYAVNTVGTILGAFLAGFVLIRSDMLGMQNSIVTAALLNCLMGAWMVVVSRPAGEALVRSAVAAVVGVALVPVVAGATGRWDRKLLISAPFFSQDPGVQQPDCELEYFAAGVDLTVAVTRLPRIPDYYSMSVNGKVDASTDLLDMITMLLLGHLPALMDQDGQEACILGLGSGLTVAAVAQHPTYRTIDCVEISDEVIKAADYFAPYCYNVLEADPRVRLIRNDGRNHLLLTDRKYDLIISGPSNPWLAGVSNLFTKEFFELCQDRLSDRGLFCSWLHGYSMALEDFRMVVGTLFEVFDHVCVWELSEDDYLFMAARRPFAVELDRFLERFSRTSVREDLYRLGQSSPGKVLGRFITSGEPLRDWAASAPVHTDDNALLEFSAPRFLYRGENLEIAEALFSRQVSPFDEVLTASPDNPRHEAVKNRAASVSRARRARIRALALGRQKELVQAMRALLRAYELDPGDPQVYHHLIESRQRLQAKGSDSARALALQPLLAQIDALCVPTVGSPRGSTLAQIVEMLGRRAEQASQRGQWALAGQYLAQAGGLAPDHADVVRRLSFALAKDGRLGEAMSRLDAFLARHPADGGASYLRAELAVKANDVDTALSCLRAALDSGQIAVERVAADQAFDPIRNDPRFRALLDAYRAAGSARPSPE